MGLCKRFAAFFLIVSIIINSVIWVIDYSNNVSFNIDTSELGDVMGNKVSNINFWSGNTALDENVEADNEYSSMNHVKYLQLMQATGGNESQDLFKAPLDRSVKDDYDFSTLLSACKGILKLGAKPVIHTGNVPLKLSSNPVIGGFGVNVCPPDDYNEYYSYICAVADALVKEFGRDEVLKWRFGVLTEYENSDWFLAESGDPEDTYVAYCKLYDYTVAALQDTIGKNVFVGAHSMSVTEGLWDERDFIKHCAVGVNYKTQEKGTKLDFLSVSFYDKKPGEYTVRTLPETIDIVRNAAESYGLYNIVYGVDEGRILCGNSYGSQDNQLYNRTVGYTYQAAYDARLIKQMVDNNINYFSSWGYLSGTAVSGYPTISYHVAQRYYAMSGSRSAYVSKKSGLIRNGEIECLSGYDEENDTFNIMAYNFKNQVNYKQSAYLNFKVNVPQLDGKEVSVACYVIDDKCNYFDEWIKDRETYGITNDCFTWSPDDPCIDSQATLSSQWAIALYKTKLRDKYIECSKLFPDIYKAKVENGKINLKITISPNAVVYYQIKANK